MNIEFLEDYFDVKIKDEFVALEGLIDKLESEESLIVIDEFVSKSPDKAKWLPLKNKIIKRKKQFPILVGPQNQIKLSKEGLTLTFITHTDFENVNNQHSRVILNHIKLFLLLPEVSCINLVSTSELKSKNWLRLDDNKFKERSILKRIKSKSVLNKLNKEFLDKVNYFLAPKSDQIFDLLGDIIFRTEGAGKNFTHFMYLKAIFLLKPVVTITFSSYVKRNVYSDIILSRNSEDLSPQEVPYTLPVSIDFSDKDWRDRKSVV